MAIPAEYGNNEITGLILPVEGGMMYITSISGLASGILAKNESSGRQIHQGIRLF